MYRIDTSVKICDTDSNKCHLSFLTMQWFFNVLFLQDLPNAMNAAEITDKLGLHSLRNRNWYIQVIINSLLVISTFSTQHKNYGILLPLFFHKISVKATFYFILNCIAVNFVLFPHCKVWKNEFSLTKKNISSN